MKKTILPIIILTICISSCDINFDKKMCQAAEYANAKLPIQANDWMWQDSVSYNPIERTYYHYFSFRVEGELKKFFRRVFQDNELAKILLSTENNSIYIENNISLGVVGKFRDGEVIFRDVYSPEELKEMASHKWEGKEIAKLIYTNMALSLNALAPVRLDECTTIIGADFDGEDKDPLNTGISVSNMELTIYWYIDEKCLIGMDETDLRQVAHEYLVELVQENRRNMLALEQHEQLQSFKRTQYPVKVTLVCNRGDGCFIRESILSSNLTTN